jgi:hypothetical protein
MSVAALPILSMMEKIAPAPRRGEGGYLPPGCLDGSRAAACSAPTCGSRDERRFPSGPPQKLGLCLELPDRSLKRNLVFIARRGGFYRRHVRRFAIGIHDDLVGKRFIGAPGVAPFLHRPAESELGSLKSEPAD